MMRRTCFTAAFIATAFAILIAALGAQVSYARTPARDPAAEKILDRYVEVTGGLKAYDKLQSSVMKAALVIPAAGITLDVTAYSARPNKFYSKAEAAALGSFERGTDGTMFWDNSVMQGPRILEGAELAEALSDTKFEGMAYWREIYDTVTVAGVDTVDGGVCDKVVLKAKDLKPRTYFFDRQTGLPAKIVTIVTSQMGDVSVETLPTDYRKVGDIILAHKSTMKIMGQERVMTISSVEYNVAMPDTVFAIPAAVQELMTEE